MKRHLILLLIGFIETTATNAITKQTMIETGTSLTSETHTTFNPVMRFPSNNLCEGQKWSSNHTMLSKTSVLDSGDIPYEYEDSQFDVTVTLNGVVESVNEPLTTPAGTFNTVVARVENDSGVMTKQWVSIEYGVLVRVETQSNQLNATSELVYFE